MLWLLSFIVLANAGISFAQPAPEKVTGNTRVHDPTICKFNDQYFIYSTGQGIEIRSSKDKVDWKLEGRVFPDGASWTDEYTNTTNGPLWAPDCSIVNNQVYLYYSASTFGSQKSAIFLTRSSTGLPGSFENLGLITESKPGDDHNAIDPALFIEGNTWYLTLGSFQTGIKGVPVSPDTGKPTTNTFDSLARRTGGATAIEASVIFKHGDYYYLFTSWDNCCRGVNSTYNIRVGRSKDLRSGYIDADDVALSEGGGTLVIGTHDGIYGPGHNDILLDCDEPFLVYHYYTADGNFLGINRLDFPTSTGWPSVAA